MRRIDDFAEISATRNPKCCPERHQQRLHGRVLIEWMPNFGLAAILFLVLVAFWFAFRDRRVQRFDAALMVAFNAALAFVVLGLCCGMHSFEAFPEVAAVLLCSIVG